MTYDLVLKNATILDRDSTGVYDVGIGDGIIRAIGTGLSGRMEIDLEGLYALPGLVDPHVHFRGGRQRHKETFYSGSRAARHGGITYVLDMPNNDPPITTPERLRKKRGIAQRDSVVNFGLYAAVTPESLPHLQQLAPLVIAFKLFMGESTGKINYPYNRLPEAFEAVAKTGKLLCVHAEDQRMLDQGKKEYEHITDPMAHALARAPEAEVEAIRHALQLADQYEVPLHVCHLTTRKGSELIQQARLRGVDVTCETCPHYLFMTLDGLLRLGPYAKMNPPLRNQEDQDALWEGIRNGTITLIASDHAPHTRREKDKGLGNIWLAPSGVPGVETTLLLLLNAVNEEKLSLRQLVRLMHDNPVERFGLGRYGYIEEGNTANLTIVDLDAPWEIRDRKLRTKCGWSPYSKIDRLSHGKGRPVMTVINGRVFKII